MKFKRREDMVDLWVELQTPEGNQMRIPSAGTASSFANLITLLDRQIQSFTAQGFNYLPQLTEEAKKLNMSYRAYLSAVTENIMCKRAPNLCHADGAGDQLHLISGKIDKLAEMLPKPVSKVAKAVIAKAVGLGTGQKKYRGKAKECSICGGRKSIAPGTRAGNLGRAGTLNARLKRRKKTKRR
jgi:hypothetical protein